MRERLLTVEDVAEMCQVHRKTVTRAIRSGRLRAAYRLRPDDVDEWIADSVVEPRPIGSSGPQRPGVLMLESDGPLA
jgi:excisionase family DNA binding protein